VKVLAFENKCDVAVVGWACRMPGANSIDALWSLLIEGRCAIGQVPADRFPLERFGHPRKTERGRSYSWAAGVLDDIWSFDPSVFGISPREAVQMDPQQRILLQLTWEAFEDAGIRPSSVAGSAIGVYVGACQVEYAHRYGMDQAVADSHFATGTSLAVISNRISHAFDLRGPSMTIDTACSSSLVALHEAVEAIRSGRIDTAIVGGANIIASPGSFIAFSQASMLSPSGLCRAFSSEADGFVRGEGCAIIVLQNARKADLALRPVHGYVVATGVNSDGHTAGISLPSLDGQRSLLDQVYRGADIDPERLAFVEAHGTGTPVGDPIEAMALGRALGARRGSARPLPIGSIKTNIGHLEPAAGMAGLIKALLALKHRRLPASLHFAEPSPHIDFEDLNLAVCDEPMALPDAGHQLAGVNSFGFGGTNAHAVVAPGRSDARPSRDAVRSGTMFAISAATEPALAALAASYAQRIEGLGDVQRSTLAGAAIHRRERMVRRAVVTAFEAGAISRAFAACAAGTADPNLVSGETIGTSLPIAFVYSGNGTQWAGMGRSAFEHGPAFAAHFDRLDGVFEPMAGWSLRHMLFADDLAEKLALTTVAQPLLFALQSAATAELRARGFVPTAVLGHSVGEVAAAEAAGILDWKTALALVLDRSRYQEKMRGAGRMLAVRAAPELLEEMLAAVDGVEVAALNGPRNVTIAGPADALEALLRKYPRVPAVDLELDYPFHTAALDTFAARASHQLQRASGRSSGLDFVSTVTGALLDGAAVTGAYWWRNMREPVRFAAAVQVAFDAGSRMFVEIGPRASLLQHAADVLAGEAAEIGTHVLLDRADSGDPFARCIAAAYIRGAPVDLEANFGRDPGPSVRPPRYPWQQAEYRLEPTVEAIGGTLRTRPLLGMRYFDSSVEWHANVDVAVYPELRDHQVGKQLLFPGTGFLEIVLSAACQWLQVDSVAITDCQLFRPLDLSSERTFDILTRISPASSSLEVFSRPRLSNAPWTTHFQCRFAHQAGTTVLPEISEQRGRLSKAQLYALAAASGLNYGEAFRCVEQVTLHDDDVICINLARGPESSAFALDPVRLDCCGHGVIALFRELACAERGVTYIPVRVDRLSLYRTGAVPTRAVLQIHSKSDRAIVADYYVLDADGQLIAMLHNVRGQAIVTRAPARLETSALVEVPLLLDGGIVGKGGIDVPAAALLKRATGGRKGVTTAFPAAPAFEKWATSAAYEIAAALADYGTISIRKLIKARRLPALARTWLETLMAHLARSKLAAARGDAWTLRPRARLPRPEPQLKAIAEKWPHSSSELMLAGWLSGLISRLRADRTGVPEEELVPPTAVLEFSEATDHPAAANIDRLLQLLDDCPGFWPQDRALRVLVVGHGPLGAKLAVSTGARRIDLTLFEPDGRALERARAALPSGSTVRLLGADQIDQLSSYDLMLSAGGLGRTLSRLPRRRLAKSLVGGGMLVALEPRPSFFRTLAAGADLQASEMDWKRHLEGQGFRDIQTISADTSGAGGSLIVATQARRDRRPTKGESRSPVTTRILFPPASAGGGLAAVIENIRRKDLDASGTSDVPAESRSSDRLMLRCQELSAGIAIAAADKARVWLIFSGALSSRTGLSDAVEAGAWSFSRVLSNEYPGVDIRRIDVPSGAPPALVAERIAAIVTSDTPETELQIEGDGLSAVRLANFHPARQTLQPEPEAALRLERTAGSAQRVRWVPTTRLAPKAGEIEIAVEATGLNFRDVMWSLSLLPDDILEDGLTGPGLGLECAGRVVRVGTSVDGLRVGDRVVCLAAQAFSTHVTVKSAHAFKIPRTMTSDVAASLPVAFLTAYYSLVTLAQLTAKDTILIHGGAGAVGMAAIQIAQWRGARIIATAGSPAKRGLLASLGVPHVLDSRSTRFRTEVLAITGDGVDVVLNSLAGEAMEASIGCLRPFGRFVELGKRDYVANTSIGLRPFRRNLSYFGVDLDQLMAGRQPVGSEIFKQVMGLFRRGVFKAMPLSVFAGDVVGDAMRLMQHSQHIGKIVIRPPAAAAASLPSSATLIDPDRTHVVTGAFGGFGMETARWLVDKGARHLALFGRRGAATSEARRMLADFARRGVAVMADPLDVADVLAVRAAFAMIARTMPPVAGVMHAAMVLDDAIVTNLDEERFQRVFAPKVTGAENMDEATASLNLDYFVLFSSITATIGHPGQGNYVAANGFMEGLARDRRGRGLPALAVRWGAISDVGVAANSEQAKRQLSKLAEDDSTTRSDIIDAMGMRARDALALLEQALALPPLAMDDAVIALSPGGRFRKELLAVLRSPTYGSFVTSGSAGAGGEEIDLRALLRSEDPRTVRTRAVELVTRQLAKVLHARPEDIKANRPLNEVGLDSLMALELALELEKMVGISFSLSTSMSTLTPVGLADAIINQIEPTAPADEAAVPAVSAGPPVAGTDVKAAA
jgi:phthiocerol/phenolphthiocerol synthesis type-I polyketide synthase C